MQALPGRRTRACFVTPWYGKDIHGGAEARDTARNLAAAGAQATVLTTCLGGPGADWGHERFPRGETHEDGVRVLRFPTAVRDRHRFDRLNARVLAGASLSADEERDFFANMVHSPALLQHLAAHPEEGPFFFTPYFFTTSVLGPLIHPARSVLVPCLRDEGYARMRAVRRAFESARAVAFHVAAERDLAASLYDFSRADPLIIGKGVDTGWSADPGRFRRKHGLEGPFILCAGRNDAGGNVPLLLEYFRRYRIDRGGAGGLRLVLLGTRPAPIAPGLSETAIDLGFVDPQDRYDAHAAAEVFVQPALGENFSSVVMEAWLAGTPVLVHSGCAVTRGHVEAAGGGLHFADYPHFAECLDRLLARPDLGSGLAAAGREYVLANYAWPLVTDRYLRLAERIGSESAAVRPGAGSRAAAAPAVHQMLPDFAAGDAIGNEVLAMQKALRSWGVRSEIFASHIQERLHGRARPVEEYTREAGPADVLVFHFSIGHRLADELPGMPGRKVLRYHNITPAHYLEGVYPDGAERCRRGREQFPRLAGAVELGLGVSAFNCAELAAAGCATVEEVPILLDLAVLETLPDPRLLARFGDGRPTVLHVGRLVPNKRIEDLVKTHYWLTRLVPRARLLIVGGGETNPYAHGVRRLMRELRVPGVYIFGHVTNAALTAYYRSAGVYLCLSEHEGFCVPLVEAMHFGLPIVARATAGVPGTLGGGGILLPRPDPVLTSEVLARVLGDGALRGALGERSRARLENFLPAVVRERLRQVLCSRLGLELG
ncbi:MAG: glycosyltransferase family 4 protein [Candidatus Methylomirabilia bacterium]